MSAKNLKSAILIDISILVYQLNQCNKLRFYKNLKNEIKKTGVLNLDFIKI